MSSEASDCDEYLAAGDRSWKRLIRETNVQLPDHADPSLRLVNKRGTSLLKLSDSEDINRAVANSRASIFAVLSGHVLPLHRYLILYHLWGDHVRFYDGEDYVLLVTGTREDWQIHFLSKRNQVIIESLHSKQDDGELFKKGYDASEISTYLAHEDWEKLYMAFFYRIQMLRDMAGVMRRDATDAGIDEKISFDDTETRENTTSREHIRLTLHLVSLSI